MDNKIIFTENAPAPIGPYSQAIQAGGFIFLSGQIPVDPKNNKVLSGTFAEQSKQVLENIKAVLEAAGCSLQHVVKVNIFLTDLSKFGEFNDIYQQYFDQFKPARACVEVSRLPKNVDIEIEAVAFCQQEK